MAQNTIKCLVWDLDETLWNGTLLESQTVSLKPNVISIIRELDERGILNSISSKNDYHEALKLLKEFDIADFFLYPQINWNAKSYSLSIIATKLNVRLDSIAIIDDQDFELGEVESAHPEVFRFKADQYLELLSHPRFCSDLRGAIGSNRRKYYLEDIDRSVAETAFIGPQSDFVLSLRMVLDIKKAEHSDLLRMTEMTERTNQLSSTGRVYSPEEFEMLLYDNGYKILVLELMDRFGTYGQIGLIVLKISLTGYHIDAFLMSCRVMSRGISSLMLKYLKSAAKAAGKLLTATFIDTGRNRLMYAAYKMCGFRDLSSLGDGSLVLESDGKDEKDPTYLTIRDSVLKLNNGLVEKN